jgi:hypothetical protein
MGNESNSNKIMDNIPQDERFRPLAGNGDSNSQYGIAGSEFTARAELVEAHSPFDKLRANGDSPK